MNNPHPAAIEIARILLEFVIEENRQKAATEKGQSANLPTPGQQPTQPPPRSHRR